MTFITVYVMYKYMYVCQRLSLGVERAAVPELLFAPGDSNVGLVQGGVAEAAWLSVKSLPLVCAVSVSVSVSL